MDGEAGAPVPGVGEVELHGGVLPGGGSARAGPGGVGMDPQGLPPELEFLLGEAEFVPGLLGEEHGPDVGLGGPALTEGAEPFPVAPPDHGPTPQDPLGVGVAEAALGEVVDLARAVGPHHPDVPGGPTGHRPGEEDPLPVGTPVERPPAEEVLLGEEGDHLAGCPVQDPEGVAVLDEGQPRSVRRGKGLGVLPVVHHHRTFLEEGGAEEVGLLLPGAPGLPDPPPAVPLRCVEETQAVRGEVEVGLPLRGGGDPLRGGRLHRGGEDLSPGEEGDLPPGGGDGERTDPPRYLDDPLVVGPPVRSDADRHPGGLDGTGSQGVEEAVVAKGQGPILCRREEADRLALEAGDLLRGASRQGDAVHVVGAGGFAQVMDVVTPGNQDRAPVLGSLGGELPVGVRLPVPDPQVPGHRGGVVLPPLVLPSLEVVVVELPRFSGQVRTEEP